MGEEKPSPPLTNPLVDQLRTKLLPKLKVAASDPAGWTVIDLSVPGGRSASVEVRTPVSITVTASEMKGFESLIPAKHTGDLPPLYIPVTKSVTWQMADGVKAFPLTRKVMHSIYQDLKVLRVLHDGRWRVGKGFWVEKANEIIISWSKSGSVERWPGSGTNISTTLNFGFAGKASKKMNAKR
jgi:hypothetical protein